MAIKLSKDDKAKEAMLHILYNYVKRVKTDRYIVEADGKYGALTLDQGIIIPDVYTKITNSEHYFRVYGEIVDSYYSWQATFDVRENGLFNMEGKEIVPLGNYAKTNAIKNFGIALFDCKEDKVIVANNTDKVRDDLQGAKLIDIGIDGYAALVDDYYAGKHEGFSIDKRTVRHILDMDLKDYKDLTHLYDNIEEIEGGFYKGIKENKYTYVNKYGLPQSYEWYDND